MKEEQGAGAGGGNRGWSWRRELELEEGTEAGGETWRLEPEPELEN